MRERHGGSSSPKGGVEPDLVIGEDAEEAAAVEDRFYSKLLWKRNVKNQLAIVFPDEDIFIEETLTHFTFCVHAHVDLKRLPEISYLGPLLEYDSPQRISTIYIAKPRWYLGVVIRVVQTGENIAWFWFFYTVMLLVWHMLTKK